MDLEVWRDPLRRRVCLWLRRCTLGKKKNNRSSGVWSVCLLQCTFIDHIFNQALREADSSQWGERGREGLQVGDYKRHLRCSSVVRRLFFSLSTSFFRKRICRIMFSGESISMDTSLGEGGAETGWSNFSWRILAWKQDTLSTDCVNSKKKPRWARHLHRLIQTQTAVLVI